MRALALTILATVVACSAPPKKEKEPIGQLPSAVTTAVPLWIPFSIAAGTSHPADPRETQLASLRQLTTDGQSRGAVWHPDGKSIYYTSGCRVHHLDLATGTDAVVATKGWAQSLNATQERLYFIQGASPDGCVADPATPIRNLSASGVFMGTRDDTVSELIPGAHQVGVAREGQQIVFSSTRDGDPELYAASAKGGDITRLTTAAGYDGSPSLSPDGSKVVWEAERITEGEQEAYAAQLSDKKLAPKRLVVMLASAAGATARVVADAGAYNTSPSFMHDSQRILFTSNASEASNFDVYLVDPDGAVTATGGPRVGRVTFVDGFDGEARISPDGEHLLFTSRRGAAKSGATNVFVARWLGP